MTINVMEKYDDYKYNYKDYGLGIIDAPSTYNNVSNYFHQELRLNCSSYSFKAPLDVWYNGTCKRYMALSRSYMAWYQQYEKSYG